MNLLLAVVLGTLFGFVLQRIGAADPDKIINMLRLSDSHLTKTILTGIGVASILLFVGLAFGLVDVGHFSVKTMEWGVVFGGVLLGVGWAISGFCPGTGVVAVGARRIDALFFVLGGLVGAGIYTLVYSSLAATFLMNPLFGGKTTLVQTGRYTALLPDVHAWIPAVLVGVLFIVGAALLPESESE
jgi:uncharacterized membrane protein YedE/YeeE